MRHGARLHFSNLTTLAPQGLAVIEMPLENQQVPMGTRARSAVLLKTAFCGLLAVCLLAGCAAAKSALGGNTRKTAVAEVEWKFGKNAILLELNADPSLNEYDGEAHTVLVGVYQMVDSAAFYKQLADPAALANALETGKAGENFVDFSRFVVPPGQRTILTLDRVQNAKYIGISTGYYNIAPANTARLFEVPLSIESSGLVAKTYAAAPAQLALRLQLGAYGVIEAERLNRESDEKSPTDTVPLDGGGMELKVTPDDVKAAINFNNAIKKLRE